MMPEYDLAIVGSGFAGSVLAMIARRLGRSVVLLERGRHPRFVIGESSTPLANLLLEHLSDRYQLPRLRPFSKWGTWQRSYPEVSCGKKRGFAFFHHQLGRPFEADRSHRNQLLVGASASDAVADTHWYRPEFDHWLVREAQACGTDYLDEVALQAPAFDSDGIRLTAIQRGARLDLRARFLVDASGARGFLQRALNLPEIRPRTLPATRACYAHFSQVESLERLGVIPKDESAPFPIDDAAVHHVFDGGWIWVLRFNNGRTSAGAAVREELASEVHLEEGAPGWQRLLGRLPTVARQFARAVPETPFGHIPSLAFRTEPIAGPGWALLPSAAGFVDPLLSTGFALTLLGVARLARIFEQAWGNSRMRAEVETYARQTAEEWLAVERLVGALYANMHDFEAFAALTFLYFASVSFSEMAARRGAGDPAGSFLLHDDPKFGPAARASCEDGLRTGHGKGDAQALRRRILATIASVDHIGFADPTHNNWYPASS